MEKVWTKSPKSPCEVGINQVCLFVIGCHSFIFYGLLYTRSGHHYRSVARPEYIQYIQQGNTTKCCPLYSIPYDIINISLRSWLTLQNTALGPTFRPSASTPTLGLHFVMFCLGTNLFFQPYTGNVKSEMPWYLSRKSFLKLKKGRIGNCTRSYNLQGPWADRKWVIQSRTMVQGGKKIKKEEKGKNLSTGLKSGPQTDSLRCIPLDY